MSYSSIMQEFELEAKEQCIPVLGTFELSSKCNLNCKFCYARGRNNNAVELSTDEWKKIIMDCVGCGLLRATFTGGEPLTRTDFKELYTFAYDLGVRITVLSNGLLFNDDICSFLSERKPEGISITMYGINDQVYENVCGIKNGFKIFDAKVDLLKKYDLPLSLKVLAIPELKDSLLKMKEYAVKKGVKISLTKYISPYENLKSDFRLTPQEIKYYANFFDNANDVMGGVKEVNTQCNVSQCSAGKTRFAVTPNGYLIGCLCYPAIKVKIDGNISVAIKKLRALLAASGCNCAECANCAYSGLCNKCPGLNYMETGCAGKCSDYRKYLAAQGVL